MRTGDVPALFWALASLMCLLWHARQGHPKLQSRAWPCSLTLDSTYIP